MTLCSNCRHPTFQPRVDISSDAINAKLRSEFGSSSYTSQNISDILLLCDRDIDDYEVEVARLRSQILYIQTQQGRLKHHKQNLRSLLSPSRWIPNEILSYIFELACDRNLLQDFPHSSPPTKLTSPIITYLPAMSMSMVSARWRMLSLSLPGLWSQLKLEIALPKTSQKFISMLKLFLERSRDHPLQLQLDISGDTIDTQHLHLDMLARNAQRWKTLCVGGDLMIRHIPEFSQLHLPNLEDLDIDYREEPVSEEDIACFQWAPKLRSLTAYAVVAPTSTVWQRLTDAHILAYSGQAEKILEECPNISNLKLSENRYECMPSMYITKDIVYGHIPQHRY
ncbi:hypothetical protein BT96DRAFT_352140 [Gymnopus androsaceus JB14]|uniref:F-box domain-containing protein n=1 Tax=Gymnopus androsaceus JB14 TaxID=1447944 RepID=A0A6A4GWN2_9AGAR|nr:hypothetical protein BT96DRAFT_352140 [Gymnopus androsaceus JB14]